MGERNHSLPVAMLSVALFMLGRFLLHQWDYHPTAFVVILLSPILEESIFRGFFYTNLRKHFPVSVAVLISAFFFAIGHQGWMMILISFFFGISAALIKERTAHLVFPVLLHIGWNLVVYIWG